MEGKQGVRGEGGARGASIGAFAILARNAPSARKSAEGQNQISSESFFLCPRVFKTREMAHSLATRCEFRLLPIRPGHFVPEIILDTVASDVREIG